MERIDLITLARATNCAEVQRGLVFLCSPGWTMAERAALRNVTSNLDLRPADLERGWLCIPTGGTNSGQRFARHDERTLVAAVRGFCTHFGIEQVNALDVLPAYHVSGLMARVRCAETGGEHIAWDWKRLETGELPELRTRDGDWVISLVPTQLQRLLTSEPAVAWLRKFRAIFVGGGPVWPELAETAARAELPVSLSYGTTETAAMVAALRPEEFLSGVRSCGTALPHARVALNAEGVVTVAGESLFRGYFPAGEVPGEFVTEDLGRFDERGHLHILGRRDAVILTGGKKVHPAEVEAALRASGEFADVAVIGVPDPEWGEAVVACYPAAPGATPDLGRAVNGLEGFQRPKRFVPTADWPRNAQGKVNREALRQAAMASGK
jgi:o-succinylbenzoate---CoA ligase